MTRNPIVNALAAIAYIAGLMSLMFYGPGLFASFNIKLMDVPEIFAGITMVSLFVFSAAMMGFIFLSKPLQLFLEGEKQPAITLFLQTVGAFGIGSFLFVLIGLAANAMF